MNFKNPSRTTSVINVNLHRKLRNIFETQFRKQFPVFGIILFIATMASVLRSVSGGWKPLYSLHVSVLVIITALAFFYRKRQGFLYGGMMITGIFIVSVGNLAGLGMVSMGILMMLVTVISVTLFYGRKKGLIVIAFNVVVIAIVGYLFSRQVITVPEDIVEYAGSARGWIAQATGFLAIGFYTVITIDVVQNHLFGLINNISAKESELSNKDERYNTMLQNIPGVVYHCLNDEHWTMKFISEEIEKLSGYRAVTQLDTVTQSNAANAEESASSGEELSAQAREMNSIVDELVTLVRSGTDNGGVQNRFNRMPGAVNGMNASFAAENANRRIADRKTEKVMTIVHDAEVKPDMEMDVHDTELMEF